MMCRRMIAGAAIVIMAALVQAPAQQHRELCYGKSGAPADTGRPERLIEDSTAIIESGRRSARDLAVAFTDRGRGHRQTFEPQHALEDFDQAIRLDPSYLPAYCERGDLYWEQGDIERARQDFDRVTRLRRRDPELNVEEL
jgi:tetratricopeptide (TPR) repeat protein